MCTMAGKPELTPEPAVYGCDGQDVAWTRSFGKYQQVSIRYCISIEIMCIIWAVFVFVFVFFIAVDEVFMSDVL